MDIEYQVAKISDNLSFHFIKWEAIKRIVNPGIPNILSWLFQLHLFLITARAVYANPVYEGGWVMTPPIQLHGVWLGG